MKQWSWINSSKVKKRLLGLDCTSAKTMGMLPRMYARQLAKKLTHAIADVFKVLRQDA